MNKDRAHANDVLNELSTKYGRTVSQIMLRWAKQRGCAVIPGTGNPGEDRSLGNYCGRLLTIVGTSSPLTTCFVRKCKTSIHDADHMKENLSVYEFRLSDEDMDVINQLRNDAKGFHHLDVRQMA
jgi:diketogulonate reductase-like aldo/keto reductase